MKNIEKNKLVEIVSSIMLKPNEDVINQILIEWENIENNLKLLDNLNLNNVQPLTHINENLKHDFLREDIPSDNFAIEKTDILNNAFAKDKDYILTQKVVK
ncbi:glutamyl-tRNA amidotransferase [Mycoplasma sp. 1018B]|uniref:glutamyl-tRNA amidotransferase n=1 Tax=Mycoplasma sp. 1018B TaxID=2967302 RepID=UPI00211BDD55|nr:glutamyl-tRNA amidotransferase [Mycoplasma sp. 1018B]UUM19316.1 glutamyl-tRNA amidotransferase [Mycoplasma sp. 1018B]